MTPRAIVFVAIVGVSGLATVAGIALAATQPPFAAAPVCGAGQALTRTAAGLACLAMPAPDLSGYQTRGEAASAQAAAAAATAAVSAATPAPCASAPPADSLMGAAGAAGCYQRGDATRPTVVQAATATTDASGAFTIAWARPFAGAAPYVTVQPLNAAGAQPVICNVTATTATTASGRCWKTVTMTLPAVATALLGLVLNPSAAAGATPVRVAGRDLTQ